MKFYLVGIKGTGMSALAQCLKSLGYMVVGSDVENYHFTQQSLDEKRIPYFKFDRKNINKFSMYSFIVGYSYDQYNNEEVAELESKGISYYYYSDFINAFFKNIKIGVSGTHGKTTVCTLLKTIFKNDAISYIIGDGSGAGEEDAKYTILEACEYKQHFLNYDYSYLVINNIEYDHPDYYNNIDEIISAFKKVAKKAKCIIVNNDDKNARKIKHYSRYTFGIDNKSFVTAKILSQSKEGQKIKINVKNKEYIFDLPFCGKHMIYNFISAFTVYYLTHNQLTENINEIINDLLKAYTSPKRRLEKSEINDNIIFSDYAHHPSEIESSYNAIIQMYPNYNTTIIFQPHTYSRTIFLFEEFQKVFKDKNVYIMDTFTSREEKDILKDKMVKDIFVTQKEYNEKEIREILKRKKQVLIFMGAGDIYKEIEKYKQID